MMDFLRSWARWWHSPRAWFPIRADTTPPPEDVPLKTEPREPRLYMSESELHEAVDNTAAYPGCETAGFLFGLKTPDGHFVVYYATQAGKNAIHRIAFCRPDLAHFQTVDWRLTQEYGVRFIGRYHSHHRLLLTHPSTGDVGSAIRLARRNNFAQMVEIVLTTEPSARSRDDVGRVHVHAYVYVDAQEGKYVPATLKIIPGVSPIRRALSESNRMNTEEPANWQNFPMERIVLDASDADGNDEHGEASLLAGLAEQFGELPANVRSAARVRSQHGLTILCLPLDGRGVVAVSYNRQSSQPQSVHLLGPGTHGRCNLTDQILRDGRRARLAPIYDYVVRWTRDERLHGSDRSHSTEVIPSKQHRKRARARRKSGNQGLE